MESIENVVNDIGDTFKGIFTGGASFSEMSTGKKIGALLIAGLVVIAIIALVYYLYNTAFGFGTSRNVGPAGCCGKLQGQRIQTIETMLSDQDLQQAENARIADGMPFQRSMFPGSYEEGAGPLGMYDNTNMGFTATKPTSDDSSARTDGPSSHAMVRPQVPYGLNMRPSYSEADFVNMAYSN